jgi:predicted Zn-dependent protease
VELEFLRTHPLTDNRIRAVREWAHKHGKAIDGPRRPLPPAIAAARAAAHEKAKAAAVGRRDPATRGNDGQ